MEQKIKVCFFVRRIGPYHHSRFLAAAKLCQLVVVQTRPDSEEYPWAKSDLTGYTIESFVNGGDVESGLRGVELKNAVRAVLNKYSPEVIVTTGWADHEYHVAVLESKPRKIPCVVISDSRYEDVPRKWHSEFVKKLLLKSYSAAITAGTQSRNYLVQLNFNPDAIFAPWDVVDNRHFAGTQERPSFNERYFLCVSRFIEKKNLPRLIEAFQNYRQSGGHRKLLIAGDGEMSSQLRDQVNSAGLTNEIHFSGFVQYSELPGLLKNALAFILPSVSDQWGLVVNEAMAAGLPVIVSSQCGCATDLVRNMQNGLIFDAYDQTSFNYALNEMEKVSEQEWIKMSAESIKIIAKYQPSDFAQALVDACVYAVAHKSNASFKLVHQLLSK